MNLDNKNRLTLGRLLTKIETAAPDEPFPTIDQGRTIGDAFRIGITGPVGAGKSTLINQLTREFRKLNFTVGIIAVDPSSPFTGGAVLGDRIRMSELALDQGVFIRSLATRGTFGGLASAAVEAADLLDMFGFDRIIIETVGVGQNEVDIVEACDAAVVVLEPGAGDDVQAIKAGLMEIADLFIVNKSDLKGAQRFMEDLLSGLELRNTDRTPAVLPAQATSASGISEIIQYLEYFFVSSSADGELEKRRNGQRKNRIRRTAEGMIIQHLWNNLPQTEFANIVTGNLPVRDAARSLLSKYLNHKE